MKELFRIKNMVDEKEYFVSVFSVKKKFRISQAAKKTNADAVAFENVIFEVSVFKEKLGFNPLFSIYLDDPARSAFSDIKFADTIKDIFTKVKISDLIDQDAYYAIFEKYGFVSNLQEIWFIPFFSRIKVVFLMPIL